MKNLKIYSLVILALAMFGCEEDFLETPPKDKFTDENYWKTEENVETFAFGFYPAYFTGYGSGFTWGNYFSGQSLNDDFGPSNPGRFIQQVPTSGGGWSFAWVRKANIFIDRVQGVPMEQEAIEHWTGVGRLFRGLEYHDLVKAFGDVPYYDSEISEDDNEQLYKARDSRAFVMDKVLEDFQYAADHVRGNVASEGLMVDRNVVLSLMSRVFLYEGTWQKYHEENSAKAAEYLEAAKWAASEVIASGEFSLGNYRQVFTSLSLSGNPEVILYREYELGMLTHALNSYNNKEPQTGPTKNAVETYLATDGLPISISPLYQGDMGIENVMTNRDSRISETFVPYELRVNGVSARYSTTAYATHKFLNEEIASKPEGSSNLNPTDAPILRYGELLVNYAEAAVELASVGGAAFSQEDLDKSINVLRSRVGVDLPDLQIIGGEPAVNGVVYDDPERDANVPSIIWEIRRERRVELMMEGFRLDDLRRWKKLDYLDMIVNFDINKGAWIVKADYPDANLTNLVLTEGEQGYVIPASAGTPRVFDDPKVYLNPLPLDQITLYRDQGFTLDQNPGW